MTAPAPPPPHAAAPSGSALAWLRSDRREPPAFLPAAQAALALEAWAAGGPALAALEARCLAGDSAAARGLAAVHATALGLSGPGARSGEAGAGGAGSGVGGGGPRGSLRDRILASTRGHLPAASAPAEPHADLPPVIAVGLRHRTRPEEPGRHAAIERLGADVREGDPLLEQVLERVSVLVDLPLLVVSIVDGAETVHRAFRCTLPAQAPRVVPREASFCTHCVADGAPLLIADAAVDPFFARHPAVAAFGLVSYCGVPLRAAAPLSPIVGTLCGYDVRPRDHAIVDVALLEVFTRRVLGVLEQRDDPAVLDAVASAEAGVDLYAAPFFADLVELARARAEVGVAPTLLVGSSGSRLVTAPDPGLRGRLVGGWLPDGRPGWLLAPGDGALVHAAESALAAASGGPVRAFAGP